MTGNDIYAQSISTRYDSLSEQPCCLSCGSALSLADISAGDVCIDLGCGRGLDVLRMATLAGSTGFAYGLDLSSGMIQKAQENAQKLGLENIAFIHSSLEEIPLQGGLADLVISNCTINHSLNQEKVWQEIARLLKPGGSFVVSDIYSIEKVPQAFRQDPQAVAQCWAGAVTRQEYLQNIKGAGLQVVDFPEESAPYHKGAIQVASFTIRGKKILIK